MGNNMESDYDKSELDNRLFEGFADTSRRRYMFLCNMKTNVSRWSKNAVEHFDLPGEYMLHAGSIWEELLHPDDRKVYAQDINAIFAGRKTRHDMDYRVKNRDGEYVACTCRGHVVKGENGSPDLFMGTIVNHSIMDNIDATTNCYNIYEFWQYMKKLRVSDTYAYVMLICINNFSEINATYGYYFGNKVLREFGATLRSVIKDKGTLFRMDGVQFACCFKASESPDLDEIYSRIQHEVRNNMYIDNERMSVSTSGGVVLYNENYDEYSIQTSARYAMGESKHKYHGELVYFDNTLLKGNKKNLEIMSAIRNSIADNFDGFYLCFQPIVDSKEERLIGAEALLRWKKEPFGEVPPGVFLPWLENDPCFWELGNWILKQALTEMKPILNLYPDFLLNVNLAYPQMSHVKFKDTVLEIIEETGYPHAHLCLELTERCHQLEHEFLLNTVEFLKSYGIKIAVDDFGTGFSSLNLLSELPVDILKIDRVFTKDIETNLASQAIVEALSVCAKKLYVHVCMEGLENRQMIDFVKQYEIYSYQGFHYSRPIPSDKFFEKYGIIE